MKKFLLSLLTLIVATATAWAADQTITLDYSSFGLTTSYATKTATVGGYSFTVNQGYKGSGNVIQMNSSKGNGTLYNTTAIQGLKSITVNVYSGNKTYTITTGTSQNPTANSQTGSATGTYNALSGDTFFQLKVSGASYFSSIVITYDPDSGSGTETVATPVISPASQNFSEDFDATITCATSGASILYSLDGSEPSIAYTGAISIDAGASVTLKAKATKTDWNDSAVAEAVYTYVEPAPEGAHYELVDFENIQSGDIVVIYDANSERAMTNDKGTSAAPAAKLLQYSGDAPAVADVTEDIKWTVEVANDGYIFYPNGTTDSWLYCTAANNGVRVGTNSNKYFVLETSSLNNKDRLKNIATTRWLGVYSNQDWRCYNTIDGTNIKDTHTIFFRYVGTPAPDAVETPVISPDGGSDLTEAQTVSLSCATDGASIYYTLDGSNPSAESTPYSAPFQVTETTTVKAIAIKEGLANSSVASATFSFRITATSIADFYEKAEGGNTVYINFPMTVTAASAAEGKTFYVTDGTSYSALFYSTANVLNYEVGNVIPAGWNATKSVYRNLIEIVPADAANMPASSSTVLVDYPVLRGSDIVADNQAKHGTLKNFELPADMPASATNINVTYDEASFVLRNSFLIDAVEAGTYDVKGVITVYNSTVQFLPLEFVEVTPEPVRDVYILGKVNGNDWAPNVGVQMNYNDITEEYTAEITVGATGGSFNMATALGDTDNWDDFNGHNYRWGVQGGGDHNVTDAEYGTTLNAQMWDNNPGAWVLPVGKYNLTWKFTDQYNATLTIEKLPKEVYIIGEANDHSFSPSEGILMTRDADTGIYTAEVYMRRGALINFAHALASNWTDMNAAGNRFSVDQNENYEVDGSESDILLAYSTDPKSISFAQQGKYEVGVDLDDNGLMSAYVTKLEFAAPTFSVPSKEFSAEFDLTITGPEGSTLYYSVNDGDIVSVDSNTVTITIPTEDTSVQAYASIYGVDSELGEEVYIYKEAIIVPAGEYYKITAGDQPLEAGKYLIVCEAVELNAAAGSPLRAAAVVNPAFNAGLDSPDAASNFEATSRHGDLIKLDENADNYFVTITPVDGNENTYTIQTASGKYIGRSANSNGMDVSEEALNNTITIDANGNADIVGTGGAYFRYNSTSGQDRFRYFKSSTYSSQKPVQLYYNGGTTGVDNVEAESEVVSTAYYNLQGVRLAAPAQGQVAIRVSTLANGKIRASKVVVR